MNTMQLQYRTNLFFSIVKKLTLVTGKTEYSIDEYSTLFLFHRKFSIKKNKYVL